MTISASPAELPSVGTDIRAMALVDLIRDGRAVDPGVSRGSGQEAISVAGLCKKYPDGTQAVDGMSFRVAAGESFGILGPNGAGKSTTIGVVGTLVRPTSGDVEVAGFDVVKEAKEVRRRIGFATQQTGTDDFATATESLILQGRLHGMSKREAAARARLLLRIMDLEDVADRRLGALSGGMKRRVDLAASLVHLPPILFLDEPTEGLDPRSGAAVWGTLSELRRELGITIVLTTHFMEEADRLCERIGLINRGSLVAEGTPEALKRTVGDQALVIDLGAESSPQDVARASQAVSGHEGARRILATDRQISIFTDDSAALAPQVLRLLELAGLKARSVSITKPTLEDVYLHYTGRAFEDERAMGLKRSTDDLERAA